MSTGDLSTFCTLSQSISSVASSLPYRGHSHPFVKFIPGYLICFEAIVNGLVSIYSFSICLLLVYRKVMIFVS
jgi:hypothetical protein